jgi:polyhydroxybutyrate depolymerase
MRARVILRAVAVVAGVSGVLWFRARPPAAKLAGNATNALVAARPYRLVAPASLDPGKAYPLVLVLHGWGGSSEHVERYYQLDPLVDERGFLVAYPQGTEETHRRHLWGGHRRFWNATDACCDFYGAGVDDVTYLDAVIDDVSAHYRVDAKRVYVMGLSNGAYMSHRYACDRAGRVAAIVSQAGAMWADASRCKPSEPVAVLQIHGTDDDLVPFDGMAHGAPGQSRLPSAHQTVRDWADFDRCDATPDTSAPARNLIEGGLRSDAPDDETTTERWTGCRGVELWTMRGAGHVPLPRQPLWGRTIYDWLASHPKP